MPHTHDYILAHLNVRAVLPAICDLSSFSKEVQDWIDGSDFALVLGVFGDVELTLYFHNRRVEIIQDTNGQSLSLKCPTHRQINNLFEDRGYFFPILTGNYMLLPKLLLFSKIAKKMEHYLRPDATELKDPQVFIQHVTMLFNIVVRSVSIVGELDSVAHEIVRNLPEGTAFFELEECKVCGWVNITRKGIRSGIGKPEPKPDVIIKFRNAEIFHAAANNRIDSLAAVGKGDIEVTGLIPLADGLDLVMARIGHYLTT